MDKRILVAGIFISLICLILTLVSWGIPVKVCSVIDKLTFQTMSYAIYETSNGFHYDVSNERMPTSAFLFLFTLAFFVYFFAITIVKKTVYSRQSLLVIVLLAIIFRLLLLPGIPVHENDIYRYLWDGKVFKHGINPYKYAPADIDALDVKKANVTYMNNLGVVSRGKAFAKDELKELSVLDGLKQAKPLNFNRIGYKWVPTIYPPTAQLVFLLSSVIFEDSIVFMKLIFIIFDILSIFLIIKLLNLFKINPSMVIIYAWSPLVLKEIANSGHYDSVPIFLVLLSMYMLFHGKALSGVISFVFAAASKFFGLVLFPIFTQKAKSRHLLFFAPLLFILYIPFIFWDRTGVASVFKGFFIYAEQWEYNDTLYLFIKHFSAWISPGNFGTNIIPKAITGFLMMLIVVMFSVKKYDNDLNIVKRLFIVLVLVFFLSPVADPWYFCWLVPFLCFFPYNSFIILSWSLIFSYLSFSVSFDPVFLGNVKIPYLTLVQYIPFVLIFIPEFLLTNAEKGYNK